MVNRMVASGGDEAALMNQTDQFRQLRNIARLPMQAWARTISALNIHGDEMKIRNGRQTRIRRNFPNARRAAPRPGHGGMPPAHNERGGENPASEPI
jgi:hypothetical protein